MASWQYSVLFRRLGASRSPWLLYFVAAMHSTEESLFA